jgi:hypothetical protein
MNADLLFNKLKEYNDDRIAQYDARTMLIDLIYQCLQYRYCYQIGLSQQIEWVDRIRRIVSFYEIYEDYDLFDRIDFFKEGESLKKIYLDVVHLMNRQGYHDIPDLHHLFTFKNITTMIECDTNGDKDWCCVDFINGLWLRKYARGHRIKWYLCMID